MVERGNGYVIALLWWWRWSGLVGGLGVVLGLGCLWRRWSGYVCVSFGCPWLEVRDVLSRGETWIRDVVWFGFGWLLDDRDILGSPGDRNWIGIIYAEKRDELKE